MALHLFFLRSVLVIRSCWGVWEEFFLSTLLIGGVVDLLGSWVLVGLVVVWLVDLVGLYCVAVSRALEGLRKH